LTTGIGEGGGDGTTGGAALTTGICAGGVTGMPGIGGNGGETA
jgi:hypothetical protein